VGWCLSTTSLLLARFWGVVEGVVGFFWARDSPFFSNARINSLFERLREKSLFALRLVYYAL